MPRSAAITAWLFLSASGSFAQPATAPQHPYTIDDFASLRSANPVALAPDGRTVLYRVDSGGAKGPTRHEWRLSALDGSSNRVIDLPEDFTPSGYTRDGGLYGSYQVNKVAQLAIVPMTNGVAAATPTRILPLPRGMHSAMISPDGTRFAILASPLPPDPLDGVRTVVEPERTSVYVVGVDGTNGSWWCPALTTIADGPIAGGAMAWSNDAASLAIVSQTPKIGFKGLRSSIDVCKGSTLRHVADVGNSVSGIAWLGGGNELAFLSTTTNVLTPDHVWTVAAAGGTAVDRTPALAGSAVSLVGDPAGHVWVAVARGVQNEIDAFEQGALTARFRWPSGSVVGLPVFSVFTGTSDTLVVAVGDPQHTPNLAVASGGSLTRLTKEGDEALARIDLGPVRTVKWTSKEGIALEGIATFPAGYQDGRRYPFLVLPHGGPESNDHLVLDFFSRSIAGLGYVVLQP